MKLIQKREPVNRELRWVCFAILGHILLSLVIGVLFIPSGKSGGDSLLAYRSQDPEAFYRGVLSLSIVVTTMLCLAYLKFPPIETSLGRFASWYKAQCRYTDSSNIPDRAAFFILLPYLLLIPVLFLGLYLTS